MTYSLPRKPIKGPHVFYTDEFLEKNFAVIITGAEYSLLRHGDYPDVECVVLSILNQLKNRVKE